MYHPGKVIEVIRPSEKEVTSSDTSVQAVLDMWDENIITLEVSAKIAAKIKEGQVVLVDYRPDEKFEAPVPRHLVAKILEGKKAKKVWEAYSQMQERKKRRVAVKAQPSPAQSYIQ
ncbi:hypothetical protein COU37_05795 [Candidatus Micrarchaeota archaeon CG10_big_fil_rev_8_21_14_0_10_45_29]|nr:MAG: hypothetical protein COU37_05795 [Candidatus Micrarchaeota archaeon CG10_big_fil_rev_8_21_14_0_10_45_29]